MKLIQHFYRPTDRQA